MQAFLRSFKVLREEYGFGLFLLLIALLLGIYIIFNALIPVDSSTQIETIEAGILSFYPDEQQMLLKENVEADDIKQLIRKASYLKGSAKEELYPQALLIAEKYEATHSLKNVYPAGQLYLSSRDKIPFLNNVTEATISAHCQADTWVIEDEGTALIDQIKTNAREDWNLLSTVDQSVNELSHQSKINRSQIPDLIDQVNKLNQQIQLIIHHPQIEAIQQKLEVFQESLLTALEMSHQKSPYADEILLKLFESESMADQVTDTSLDIRPKVALTFDDGPNESFTPQVLDILKDHSIQATFFVVGRSVKMYPEVARRIVNEGHIIANHSYDHPNFTEISDQEVRYQINHTQEIIQRVTGQTPSLYRMPYGAGGERVYRMFPDLTSITWNTDTGDWYLRDAQAIFDNLTSQVSDDMLVLLHDTNQDSVDALKKMIPAFIDNHYRFVEPTELKFDYRY